MKRVIADLRWARFSESGPELPLRRARGAKAAGLRYERGLAKALPKALHGPWLEFEDLNGHGWCQPDFILQTSYGLAVVEAKYTWVAEGHEQLATLYQPVIEAAIGTRPLPLVVCHNLTPTAPKARSDLGEALIDALAGRRALLHWLGAGPLLGSDCIRPLGAMPKAWLGSERDLQQEMDL